MKMEGPTEDNKEKDNNEEIEKILKEKNWSLPSNLEVLDPAKKELEERLKQNKWKEDEIGDISLGFHEALANAIKHGNKYDSEKTVDVSLDITDKMLFIKIHDEGDGYDPDKVPNPLAPENLTKTSGRGLLMLRTYFDSVELADEGRTIYLSKENK